MREIRYMNIVFGQRNLTIKRILGNERIIMENSSKSQFHLSRLVAILEEVLDTTTRTKKLLHISCDETEHLLSNWQIPDISVSDETPQCTCDVNIECTKISEVAKNIEQVVEQAQKLRDIHSQTQSRISHLSKRGISERNTPKSGLGTKHIPQVANNGSKKLADKVQKKIDVNINSGKQLTANSESSAVLKKSVGNQSATRRSYGDNRSPRTMLTNVKRRSIPVPMPNGNSDKKVVTKPKLKSMSLQTTYQKDFSVRASKYSSTLGCSLKPKESSRKDNTTTLRSKSANMSHVRDIEKDLKISDSLTYPGKMEMSDLEDLLNRVSIYPNSNVGSEIKKFEPSAVSTCLQHGDKTLQVKKKAYTMVELAEAVDILGVPSDLIKVLKPYHSFLAENQEGRKCTSGIGKGQEAAKSFLNNLCTMNGDTSSNLTYEPLIGLFSEYRTLVAEASGVLNCSRKGINDEIISCLENKSQNLERRFRKWSNIDESVSTSPTTPNQKSKVHEENYHCSSSDCWAMMGIWNLKSRQRFKALGEMKCIRYSSEGQWKKFEANLQEIQRMELQVEMFQVIESIILPQLFNRNPQDPVFPFLLKTVCLLCNITMLTSPLIIRSA